MKEKTYAARTEATTSPPGSARGRRRAAGRRSASPGAAVNSRIAPLTWVFRLSQTKTTRGVQLLVRGVQEPGVVRLGEPLALSPRRARCVR